MQVSVNGIVSRESSGHDHIDLVRARGSLHVLKEIVSRRVWKSASEGPIELGPTVKRWVFSMVITGWADYDPPGDETEIKQKRRYVCESHMSE
jgi:hypothetical protein